MTAAENKSIVEKACAAWARGDSGSFYEIVADDVRWTVIGFTPISGMYSSKAQFLDQAIKPLRARLRQAIRPTVRNIIAEGDHVVLQWDGVATSISGRPYTNSYCWVLRLRDGQVKECTAYLDTAAVSELWL
jgi:uncharacterized protein